MKTTLKPFSHFTKNIFEDFKTTSKKFVDAGANPEEVQEFIQRFRALNNAHRLQGDEKNIDYWGRLTFDDFRDFVEAKEQEKTKTEQRKNVGKRIDLKAPEGWNFYIPLDKAASCYKTDKATDWCVAKRDWNYFEKYIYDPLHPEYSYFDDDDVDKTEFRFLVYVLQNLDKKYWAMLFTFSGKTKKLVNIEIFNQVDVQITVDQFNNDVETEDIYVSIYDQVSKNLEYIKDAIDKEKLNSIDWLVKNVKKRDENLEALLVKSRNIDLIETYMSRIDGPLIAAARLFSSNAEYAYRYAYWLPEKMWSGNEDLIDPKIIQRAEQEICKSNYKIQEYIRRATKRFPMGERTLVKSEDVYKIYSVLAHYNIHNLGEWPEGLRTLALSGNINLCVNYAVLATNKRFKLFEDFLIDYMSNNKADSENFVYDFWRYMKAFEILDQNLVKAFITAAGDNEQTVWYIYHFADFYEKELEELISDKTLVKQAKEKILLNLNVAVKYARDVMKRRWIEAEDTIKKNWLAWEIYTEMFEIEDK